MTKRIKHVSELPKWFQISKYRKANQLDSLGWYAQLTIRQELEAIIACHINNDPNDEEFINDTQDVKEIIELVHQNPIVNINSDPLIEKYFFTNPLKYTKNPYSSLGVHSLTIEELFRIEESVDPKELELLWRCHHSSWYFNHPKREQIYDPVKDHAEPYRPQANSAAYIDWELPDSQLIDHFKQFLIANRPHKIEHPTKRYRKIDFQNWCRFGVLPYLDLTTWEMEENVTIPNRVMAAAIFSNSELGEETIRKTTRPLAEKLQEEEILNLFASQIRLEKTEENNS